MHLPSDGDRSGRNVGAEELEFVRQVLETGTLWSVRGTYVSRLQNEFAARYGMKHAFACTSGTAAVHLAVAALNPEPGDEFVTTAITDMGALTPILYQGAIPVFCDVDPDSYCVTAETIEPRLTKRTKAVIVTHLFGIPCDMGPIMELCTKRNIPVIEDCAQAFDATYDGQVVGTFGSISCFSFQQGKHMTTGEGGMVMTNDADLARRMHLFVNKAWGYGDPRPDHYFLALNYRMNEVTAAVGIAQLGKLSDVVLKRRVSAARFTKRIATIPGVTSQKVHGNSSPVYWKFCVNVNEHQCGISLNDIAAKMKENGIFAAPRYIGKPAFECQVFRDQVTLGNSRWPYSSRAREKAPTPDHDRKNFPGTIQALSQVLVIPWNEYYTNEHVDYIADNLRKATQGGRT